MKQVSALLVAYGLGVSRFESGWR